MSPATNFSENYALAIAVHEVARATRRSFDRRARALGYTQSQWRVLWGIAKAEGTSQAALADSLEMQPIALARIVDRMEEAGLVERRPDPNDRRAVKLFLTVAAGPIVNVLRGVAEEVLAIAVQGVPAESRAHLTATLQTIRGNLERDSALAQRTEAG
jgi:DNA-binding MarR family transcriptional regulator